MSGSEQERRKSLMETLVQFIKFGIVGVSNTAISYAIEMLCYYVLFVNTQNEGVKIFITSLLAFVVSVTNSYYWNNKHVFSSGERKTLAQHLCTYLKTAACYGLTGLLLSPWAKAWLVEIAVPYWLATLLVLVFTIPLNFTMNKLWAFRPDKSKEEHS